MSTTNQHSTADKCREYHDRGFNVRDIAHLTGRTTDDVRRILGTRLSKRNQHAKDRLAALLADVPPGRDPAEHRRCVEMNFGAIAT